MIDILRIYYNSHAFVNGCCESWNETDEGGSMHVRRMAKDLSDKNVFNFTSTLLARVVSSSLPLFISSHSFLLPSLISSSLFIYVHLARDSLLFSSLTLATLAILPALQKKKKLSAKFLFVLSLSSSFLPVVPSFLCFVFFSPLLLSLFLFITNGITDDSEIFARTICSSVFEHDRETFPRWLRELPLCSCPS